MLLSVNHNTCTAIGKFVSTEEQKKNLTIFQLQSTLLCFEDCFLFSEISGIWVVKIQRIGSMSKIIQIVIKVKSHNTKCKCAWFILDCFGLCFFFICSFQINFYGALYSWTPSNSIIDCSESYGELKYCTLHKNYNYEIVLIVIDLVMYAISYYVN